jgi:hypothetical protein
MAARRGRVVRMAVGPTSTSEHMPEQDAQKIPYEDFGRLEKEAVEDAVREAWKRLPTEAQRRGIDLMEAGEVPITRLLRDELDKLRRDETEPVQGFTERAFQHIPEGEWVPECSDTPSDESNKCPDLVFRPVISPRGVIRTSTYGLFVECKIVHRSTDHHGIFDYCNKGLLRFTKGRYAWMMPSAMMIAYVRNGKDVPSFLTPYLSIQKYQEDYEVKTLPTLRKGQELLKPPIYVSTHGRQSVKVRERSPGDIEIAHLWLDVA